MLIELATVQVELARCEPGDFDSLSRRLERLLERVKAHECRENMLVLDAFNEEPGALD
jgi:hypothetical protein